jgi:signal transduction histidine kinase
MVVFLHSVIHRLVFDVPEEFSSLYRSHLHKIFVQRLRIGYLLSIVLIPGAFIFDILIFPEEWKALLVGRMVSVGLCLLMFLLFNTTKLKANPSAMGHLLNFVVSATIVYLTSLTGGYESPYYAGLILIFIFLALVFPWGIKDSLAAGLVTIITYYGYNLLPTVLSGSVINSSAVWNSLYFLAFSLLMVVTAAGISEEARRRLFVGSEQEKIRNRKLAESKEQIDALMKTRSRFISNITHELKTPLSIVIGNTELISHAFAGQDEEMERQLRLIRRAAFQLATHVDRIITVSSTEDREFKLKTEFFNYPGVARNVFALFEDSAQERNIRYSFKSPEESLVAALDVVAMEEVLNNLIQNAFKFTPAGGAISVTVGTDGMEIFTEVADTGQGIPADKLESVFERLYQGDDDLARRHAGIGIGLFLVKRNVELHGGQVSVHSRVGSGSVFRFTLPLFVDQTVFIKNPAFDGEDRRTGETRRNQKDRRARERLSAFEYQKVLGIDDLAQTAYVGNLADQENCKPTLPTILIVEDNPGMMKVTADALFEDYNLFLAKDAFEALDKLHDHHQGIALILSDVMMPAMDGFDFCSRVMADKRYEHIPIIFVTALMDEKEQLKGYEAGATDYIVKPYNMRILKEKVAHWISRRQYEMLLHEMSSSVEPRLEELSRYKDVVVHEINNPLQVISIADAALQGLSALSYREAPKKDEEIRRYISQVHDGVEAIKSVLETSLDLQGGEIPVKQEEPLSALIDDAVEQSRHFLGRAQGLNANLGAAGSARVLCDRKMLTRVFVNLIRNAAEAISGKDDGRGGEIAVSAGNAGKGFVAVRIEDNGVGIARQERDRLFQFRYTTKKDGSGVGLHVVKTILRLHEGTIAVESEPGVGSTFIIRLPVAGEGRE